VKKNKYTVGYGKPPKHSRFKPGQSGNPKGRPKGARGLGALLDEELKQSIPVTEGGRTRKLRKLSVIVKAVLAKAMKGDARALQFIVNHSATLKELTAAHPDELEAQDHMLIAAYERRRLGKSTDDDL